MRDMRIEIIGLDDTRATCEVTDGPRRTRFTVGSNEEAHALLRLMVRNAAMQLKHLEVEEWERAFAERAGKL